MQAIPETVQAVQGEVSEHLVFLILQASPKHAQGQDSCGAGSSNITPGPRGEDARPTASRTASSGPRKQEDGRSNEEMAWWRW